MATSKRKKRSNMKQRLIALAEDKVLTQKEKERVITTARLGIVCVAYYALNARERGAYCISFRKRLEFRTARWQEETAGQTRMCLQERIPGTPQPAGVTPLPLTPITASVCQRTAFTSILSAAILDGKGDSHAEWRTIL
jgi:hypothetical protein